MSERWWEPEEGEDITTSQLGYDLSCALGTRVRTATFLVNRIAKSRFPDAPRVGPVSGIRLTAEEADEVFAEAKSRLLDRRERSAR